MSAKHEYTLLPAVSTPRAREPRSSWWLWFRFAFFAIFPVITAVAGFWIGLHSGVGASSIDNEGPSNWSPELATMKKRPVKFRGSFNFTNRFRGPPSAELDREWARFTQHPLSDGTASIIAVNMDDIANSNKTDSSDFLNSTVEYPQANGGGYMATLEMFHQLHCLNMVRKAVHSEYYEEMKPAANGFRPALMATHLDHCIEILRQVINCYGDTGLITFHWVRDNPTPYPDFNTWHQCKDPEEILAWSKRREAPIKVMVEKGAFPSIIEMPEAP